MRGISCCERTILEQDGPEEVEGDRVFSTRTLTARVGHAYEGCPYDHDGGGIAPGERYQQVVGLDADMGRFFVRRYCKSTACHDRQDAERQAAEEACRAAHPPRACSVEHDPDNIPF